MKILLVNKFLYSKGGAETYVIKLSKMLNQLGHDVQCFGMQSYNNVLFNKYNLYVTEKNFEKKKFFNIFELISNKEAYIKFFKILNEFHPDLVISNNIEFHLTPSIILAYKKYKKINSNIKWFYVAHDFQIICPSHGLFDSELNPCEKCLVDKNFWNCYKTKCHKNSKSKSLIATLDSIYWHKFRKIYEMIDIIVCPSYFMKSKIDQFDYLKEKTRVIHNFVDEKNEEYFEKKDYVIEFGKLCQDKGTETLLDVAEDLPNILFVFAGYGDSVERIKKIKNCLYVGFKSGDELKRLIGEAKISICPSEWYENCPFSVIESQMYGTPVLGSNIGGIPELIAIGKTGEIFEPKNSEELKLKLLELYKNPQLLDRYSENCRKKEVETLEAYCQKIVKLYGGKYENN